MQQISTERLQDKTWLGGQGEMWNVKEIEISPY